jgi:hypothetical protein
VKTREERDKEAKESTYARTTRTISTMDLLPSSTSDDFMISCTQPEGEFDELNPIQRRGGRRMRRTKVSPLILLWIDHELFLTFPLPGTGTVDLRGLPVPPPTLEGSVDLLELGGRLGPKTLEVGGLLLGRHASCWITKSTKTSVLGDLGLGGDPVRIALKSRRGV